MPGHPTGSSSDVERAPTRWREPVTSRIRVVPELRNYHVGLLPQMVPAKTFFFWRKYDLTDGALPAELEQITFSRLLRVVAGSDARTLELWEPLWVRLLPRHVVLGLTWRLGRPGQRRRLVSAAMENNDLDRLVGGVRSLPPVVVGVFAFTLGVYLRLVYSRLVYATESARDAYHRIPGVDRIPHAVITHLPARPAGPTDHPREASTVVFLARLELRKGVRELMAQWPEVSRTCPGARLLIIGDGPEADEVDRWCARDPSSRRYLGPLPHGDALAVLRAAAVLVLPSVREGRWREQVGLPIHEGLLSGATIVTSDESGLAPWLRRHGHRVVAADRLHTDLAAAILDAIRRPLPRDEVLASLPRVDARVAQNHWLHDV